MFKKNVMFDVCLTELINLFIFLFIQLRVYLQVLIDMMRLLWSQRGVLLVL